MKTKTQFEFPDVAPLSRLSDPATSGEAADKITRSGLRASQKRAVLNALLKSPTPPTSAELAQRFSIDRYVAARRLPDLERDGLVEKAAARVCEVTGNRAVTWRVRA